MNEAPKTRDPHQLPPLREISPFGDWLRRFLLPLTILCLGLLVWAGVYTVKALDLQLDRPVLPMQSGASDGDRP